MLNLHFLNNFSRRSLLLLAAISFMSVPLHLYTLAQTESREPYRETHDAIEGSWICTINRIAQGDSFTALTSFTAGGVVVATGSLDKVNPISPIYGSWKRSGYNRIVATIYFFLFDPVGNPVGMLKTDETYSIDGRNRLIGAGSSFVCDVDGKNCSNHGTQALIAITGKRIVPSADSGQ